MLCLPRCRRLLSETLADVRWSDYSLQAGLSDTSTRLQATLAGT